MRSKKMYSVVSLTRKTKSSAYGGGGISNISLRLRRMKNTFSACGGEGIYILPPSAVQYNNGELNEFPLTPPLGLEYEIALFSSCSEKKRT
jgi:hypothetical protein